MHCFSSVCPVRQNLAQLLFFFIKHVNFQLQDHNRILGTSNRVRSHQCFFFFYKMYFFQSSVFIKLHFFTSGPQSHHSYQQSGLSALFFFYKMYFFRIIHFCKLQFFRYRSKVTSLPSATDFTPIKKG